MLTPIDNLPTWRAESGAAAPRRVVAADDTMSADTAYRLACEGTGLLWQGDFHNARQLLQALARRTERKPKKNKKPEPDITPVQAFNAHRQALGQRARILAMVIVPMEGDYTIPLRRAPDLKQACTEAWGPPNGEACMVSLRELLGLVGAHEWRKKGVVILARDDDEIRIHPHYGVFSPIRGEYIELLLKAPLPALPNQNSLAFDIGTGTGVLAVVLALRDIQKVVATDLNDRAITCAQDNVKQLGLNAQIEIQRTNLFPEGKAALIVCNPPWLPARPSSSLEHAVYDPDSQMLKGFLSQLKDHLSSDGEGWLILSDLAEHLGLRSREELLSWIEAAGLKVIARLDTKPQHPKAFDKTDTLHAARSREVTSLWRLAAK